MKTYTVSSKNSGIELWSGLASSAEDALLKCDAEIVMGDVSVYDDQRNGPAETVHFDSVADALKIYVPEAIAHIAIVEE